MITIYRPVKNLQGFSTPSKVSPWKYWNRGKNSYLFQVVVNLDMCGHSLSVPCLCIPLVVDRGGSAGPGVVALGRRRPRRTTWSYCRQVDLVPDRWVGAQGAVSPLSPSSATTCRGGVPTLAGLGTGPLVMGKGIDAECLIQAVVLGMSLARQRRR